MSGSGGSGMTGTGGAHEGPASTKEGSQKNCRFFMSENGWKERSTKRSGAGSAAEKDTGEVSAR